MIRLECPSCGKKLNLPDKFAGKKGKCPGCQEMLTIPAASEEAAVAPAPVKARKPAPPPVEEVEEVDEAEPEEETEPEEKERVVQKPAKKRPRPVEDEEDEERVAQKPTKKRPPPDEGEEEEDEDRLAKKKKKKSKKPKGEWAECPSCGASDATRVHWTLWGGMIGPAFINTVRCHDCGAQYNGVRGDYNTTRIIIFMAVNLVLAAVIGTLVFYLELNNR